MQAAELLFETGLTAPALNICGLTADSRDVLPGYLFAALSGTHLRGSSFIDDAIARGASLVIADQSCETKSVPVLGHDNPRHALALCARNFFGFMPEEIAAVTGTNGKTSVATLVRQFWAARGFSAASLGTLGVQTNDLHLPLIHTTPEPVTLHAALRDLVARQVTHCVMEASSHGLVQSRLDGVCIKYAGFTNLSHDHLDYHPTLEDYMAAKERLFTQCLAEDGVAIINVGQSFGRTLADKLAHAGRRVISVGALDTDLHVESCGVSPRGQDVRLSWQGQTHDLFLPLIGDFQCENLAVAMAMAAVSGVPQADILASIGDLSAPIGRMQHVGETAKGAHVYIDYAHTPDALQRALLSLRAHCNQKIWVVFGCGGDRDATKRPLMGGIAATYADRAIVTDDNPRNEAPDSIRAQILTACSGAVEIADRALAIAAAVDQADRDDVVLIAGKGHEEGQIVAGVNLPFSDLDQVQRLLARASA